MNNKNQLKTTGLQSTLPMKNNMHPALYKTLLISIFFYNYEITKKTVQRSNAPSMFLPVLLLSIDNVDRFVIQKIIFFFFEKIRKDDRFSISISIVIRAPSSADGVKRECVYETPFRYRSPLSDADSRAGCEETIYAPTLSIR